MTRPVTIKDVRTIMTQPAGSRLIVVKIITSEPGLYGLGCATFTQRFHVGHAANLHLDLWAPNFGIQEWCRFPELVREMFPGTPEVHNGYMVPNDRPGLGVDIDEKLAAKYPCQDEVEWWTQTRLPDGSPARP